MGPLKMEVMGDLSKKNQQKSSFFPTPSKHIQLVLEATHLQHIFVKKKSWIISTQLFGVPKISTKIPPKNLTKNLDLSNLSTNLSGLSGHLTLHFFCIDDLFGHRSRGWVTWCQGESCWDNLRWSGFPDMLREVQVMVGKIGKVTPSRYYRYTWQQKKRGYMYIYIYVCIYTYIYLYMLCIIYLSFCLP